jgi:hypothetical protein
LFLRLQRYIFILFLPNFLLNDLANLHSSGGTVRRIFRCIRATD